MQAQNDSIKECLVFVEKLDDGTTPLSESNNQNQLKNDSVMTNDTLMQPARRYSTRLSTASNGSNGVLNSEPTIKRVRSAAVPRPKPAFIEYKGKVEYYTEFHDIAFASDNLL